MIIVGYQGIGKSTLCQHRENCIDLESSCFDKPCAMYKENK